MKRIFQFCLLLCFVVPIAMEAKKKAFGNGVYWELSNDGTLTISGNGEMPNYKYSRWNKNDLKNGLIAPWWEKKDEIKDVVIENGITYIGKNTFAYLPIKSVVIPTSVKSIGEYAFCSCDKLNNISISNSVVVIGDGAFQNCNSLTGISLPNSVTYIGVNAFRECSKLASVKMSSCLVSIQDYAFSNTGLKSISIPPSVKEIGKGVFYGCDQLYSAELPNNLKTIESFTFGECTNLRTIVLPQIKKIGVSAFQSCKSLSKIVIPNSVELINDYAFAGCEKLVDVEFPESLFSISKGAFANCNLRKLSIPENLYTIGSNAFAKTIQLKPLWYDDLHTPDFELLEYYDGMIVHFPKKFLKDKDSKFYGISQKCIDVYLNTIFSAQGEILFIAKEGQTVNKIDISENGVYYTVKDGSFVSLMRNKDVLISSSRGYNTIKKSIYGNGNFTFTKNGYIGVCDSLGHEISTTKLAPTADDIKTNGSYDSAVEMKNGNTKYYKVSKGGRYGLTDSEGKEIVPCEMEALESAGTGYLKYKINGFWGVMNYIGKIIIGTERGYTSIGDFVTFSKRFPYTMAGYKGECDATGRQVSKIKDTSSFQSNQNQTDLVISFKYPTYLYLDPVEDLIKNKGDNVVSFDFNEGKIKVTHKKDGKMIRQTVIIPSESTIEEQQGFVQIYFTENGIPKRLAIIISTKIDNQMITNAIMWIEDQPIAFGEIGTISRLASIAGHSSSYDGKDFDVKFNKMKSLLDKCKWKKNL